VECGVLSDPSASFCGEASANGADAAPSGDCDGSGDSSSDGGGDGDGGGGARSSNGVMHNGILSFFMLAISEGRTHSAGTRGRYGPLTKQRRGRYGPMTEQRSLTRVLNPREEEEQEEEEEANVHEYTAGQLSDDTGP